MFSKLFSRGNTAQSSDRIVSIAQRGMKNPDSLSATDIRSLCGSVLRQAR